MPPKPSILQQRLLCTKVLRTGLESASDQNKTNLRKWSVKQVTKWNFSEALEEIKTHISNSDFIAVSLQNTGAYTFPWQKIQPFDTAEIAYLKAKYAAERFQIFQFAVCPFSIKSSKLVAYPYNFHLFPRDELKIGMPSYSFSCQSSFLTSMAREDFDFNACIYDGITYLSRAQESTVKDQIGHALPKIAEVQCSSSLSVADSIFLERIKSRVKHWINACKTTVVNKSKDPLISSLLNLISKNEVYGSRPSLSIDVCSERQVQLAVEMLKEFPNVVPLVIPDKGVGVQAVQVVLTSSKEDKELLEEDVLKKEEENCKHFRGFREVVDLIAASQKPVVAHNSLNDFTFIYSKFLGPLPSTIDEFRASLHLVFPHVLDVNHLMKEIGPPKKLNNVSAAISHLKRRFSVPIDVEIPLQGKADEAKIHGQNVLRISRLFSKLCSILKITTLKSEGYQLSSDLQCYANIFGPCSTSSEDPADEDVRLLIENARRIGCENLVFVWGFKGDISARKLKNLLHDSHEVFSGEFDVRQVDKSCAVVVFWDPGRSTKFVEIMDSGGVSCKSLEEMISEGLRAAKYESYRRVCELGLWETELADALEKAAGEAESHPGTNSEELSVIYWDIDDIINLDEL